jgi:hypothetical protein
MMNSENWKEYLDRIVSVGGVKKRLGECTEDDLRQLIRDCEAELARTQAEVDHLRRLSEKYIQGARKAPEN